ncbi:exopolysaccharide biosynthesis protein [Synechocystis sp. LEGE 06083]|uniref:exopolysaccharide biosynthesis protein n=1 Tax=Synechocystis sp. LEGE 06083 TaxID=915336 RepID=UPI00187E0509|nr:exopolysaccharide biosynthesis protein [Synechocystis sp. LEGE 06083]MBE9195663.1 exopolysaccharide biosynthesis protein [Synechocystis sp. LEGE 06083]
MARLSQELQDYFFKEDRGPTVNLAQVLAIAKEKIFGIVLVILSLPSALPLPAPGYSTPFGVLIFLVAIQLIAGRQQLWLPLSWQSKTIKTSKAQGIVKAGVPWLKRLEAIAHPRLPFVCQSRLGRVLMGVTIGSMAISMMIPIPGTNTLPAMTIFITGFGLQEDDGLITGAGMIFSVLIGVLMVSVIYVFFNGGITMIDIIKDWLKMQLGGA